MNQYTSYLVYQRINLRKVIIASVGSKQELENSPKTLTSVVWEDFGFPVSYDADSQWEWWIKTLQLAEFDEERRIQNHI